MSTKFIPLVRQSKEEILKIKSNIENSVYIRDIFNSLPYIAAILNSNRQVILSNEFLLKQFNISSIEEIIGSRPGEIITCTNSQKAEGGCGASENCKFCGVAASIERSQNLKIKTQFECRIRAKKNGQEIAYDFLATSNPIKWNGEEFIILALTDISSEKRRKALERTFFHDIINRVGSIQGFLQLIQGEENIEKIKEFTNIGAKITEELVDEVLSHRQLLNAENGKLAINIENIETISMLSSLKNEISNHISFQKIYFVINNTAQSHILKSDITLLRRILLNMLKNAAEASEKNDTILISCEKRDSNFIFSVHNKSFIPINVQLQIFQRSFSTKGLDRGIGTYSMQLFAENYLNGKVYFKTNKTTGTTFFVEIPNLKN